MISKGKTTMKKSIMIMALLTMVAVSFAQTKMPPPMEECVEEPVKYTGSTQPDGNWYDAGLPHAVGGQTGWNLLGTMRWDGLTITSLIYLTGTINFTFNS